MVTLVGTQANFIKAIIELVELELIATKTYEAAIERLEDNEYKKALKGFKSDHTRHIQELSEFLGSHGEKARVPRVGSK